MNMDGRQMWAEILISETFHEQLQERGHLRWVTSNQEQNLRLYLSCWWRGWYRGTALCWGDQEAMRGTPCAREGSAVGWWAWTGWGAGWGWRSPPGPEGTEEAGCWRGALLSHLQGICNTRATYWSKYWSHSDKHVTFNKAEDDSTMSMT